MRGRVDLGEGVLVERHILCLPGHGIWVADLVETGRPRGVRSYWQMPAAIGVKAASDRGDESSNGSSNGSGNEPSNRPRTLSTSNGVLQVWSGLEDLRLEVTTPVAEHPAAWEAPNYGARQPATRVCCSATAAKSGLTVSFFGATPLACCVQIGEYRLECCEPGFLELPSSVADISADVLWCVETPSGRLALAAGLNATPDSDNWDQIDGTGGWAAAKATKMATVSEFTE